MIGDPSRPTVSVIVPTYNREQWLPVSVGSVLAQTWHDWELLLVDDHSTDRSAALIDQYARNDSRIRYALNRHKKGPAGARNHGVDLARGRYVAFLDSDDEWEKCHLREMIHYLLKYPDRIDVMTANAVRKNRHTNEVYGTTDLDLSQLHGRRLEDAFLFDSQSLFDMSLRRSLIITQTMVMKREVLTRVQFDEDLPPGPEDRLFHLEIAYQQMKVAHLPSRHVTYWAHGDNLTCCGGLRHPSENIGLFLGYEQVGRRCLDKFALSEQRRRRVRRNLARMCVWQIGYNGFLTSGQYGLARKYFLKGIRLDPYRFAYWKTFLASYAHQLLDGLRSPSTDASRERQRRAQNA